MTRIFWVSGASGSGKSACVPHLKQLLPQANVHDFDELVATTTAERQRVAEQWIQRALDAPQDMTVICGLGVMGEVLACPSALKVERMAFCLLDCDEIVRIDRIRRSGDLHNASQDMLNWGAWLRVHFVDPQWRPDVITNDGDDSMHWERWAGWERGDPRWQAMILDTSNLTIPHVAEQVVKWIYRELQKQ